MDSRSSHPRTAAMPVSRPRTAISSALTAMSQPRVGCCPSRFRFSVISTALPYPLASPSAQLATLGHDLLHLVLGPGDGVLGRGAGDGLGDHVGQDVGV